jgi:hypothetical protein
MEPNVVQNHILQELLEIRQKQEEILSKLVLLARLEERQVAHKGDLDRAFEEIRRQERRIDELDGEIEELKQESATKKPIWSIVAVAATAFVTAVVTNYMHGK